MAKHDDLLDEGPRQAPEPETAEQKSKKLGLKTAGGGVAAGGIGLAKVGVLGKVFLWLFLWNGISSAWRIGGWMGSPSSSPRSPATSSCARAGR